MPISQQDTITLSEGLTSTIIHASTIKWNYFARSTENTGLRVSINVATITTESIRYIQLFSQITNDDKYVGIFLMPELTAAGSSVVLVATFSVLMVNGTAVNQKMFTKSFSPGVSWGIEKFVEREWVLHTPHVLHNDSLLIRVDLIQTVYAAMSQQQVIPIPIDDSYRGNVNMMFNWTVCNLAQLSRAPGQLYLSTDWFPSNTKLPTFFLQMYPMGHSVKHEGYVSLSCCGFGMSPLVSGPSLALNYTFSIIDLYAGKVLWSHEPWSRTYYLDVAASQPCYGPTRTLSFDQSTEKGRCIVLQFVAFYNLQ